MRIKNPWGAVMGYVDITAQERAFYRHRLLWRHNFQFRHGRPVPRTTFLPSGGTQVSAIQIYVRIRYRLLHGDWQGYHRSWGWGWL